MQNKIFKTIFLLTSFFMLPSFALAAPSVSSVSGTVSNGSSITISGSGFGAKTAAAPSLFDRTEGTWTGLTNGSAIPADATPWTGDTVSFYDTLAGDQRSAFSTANYYNNNSTYNFVDGYTILGRPTRLYVSWWFKDNLVDTGGKFLRLSDSTDQTNKTFSWANAGSYLYDNGIGGNSGYCTVNGGAELWVDTQLPENIWHFHEIYFDTTAKTWSVFVDNVSYGSATYLGCDDIILDQVWKVGMDAGGTNPPSQTSWLDDIYVDSSWAHVVIGDASTYSASTHFEVQLATAWNSNGQSITASINQGTFANGSTAYLYVIDASGNVSNGQQITFGNGSSDTTPPAAPSGLSVI